MKVRRIASLKNAPPIRRLNFSLTPILAPGFNFPCRVSELDFPNNILIFTFQKHSFLKISFIMLKKLLQPPL